MKTEKIKDSYGSEIKVTYKDMNKRKMNSLQKEYVRETGKRLKIFTSENDNGKIFWYSEDYVLWLESKHQSF